MAFRQLKCFIYTGLAGALIATSSAQCQEESGQAPLGTPANPLNLEQFRQELESQTKALVAQQRTLEEQEKKLAVQKRELADTLRRMEALQAQVNGTTKASTTKVAQAEPSPAQPVGQRPQPTEIVPPPVAPIF